jgi:hypothetical protein
MSEIPAEQALRELRIVGVRRAGDRAELVVDAEVPVR